MLYQQIIKIAKSLRAVEALLLTGFILIGGVYSNLFVTTFQFTNFLWLFLISYSLMVSVYTANAFLGKEHDKINPRLKSLRYSSGSFYLMLTILIYIGSAVLCLLLFPNAIYLHFSIFALCFVYALPGFGKHLPIFGTFIHFLVGMIQFNFAYMFFNPICTNSVAISVYFGLIFSAGHLHHEVIDYEVDLANKIKSSAVTWGYKTIEKVSFAVFAFAHAYLLALILFKIALLHVFIVFILGFLLHSFFFFTYYRQIDKGNSIRTKYRSMYRLLYFMCGLIFLYMILHKSIF